MKKIYPILILMFIFLSWYVCVNGMMSNKSNYKKYIKKAEECEDGGYYKDAINNYQYALKIDSKDKKIEKKICINYYNLNNHSEFISRAEKIISENKGDAELSELITKSYIQDNKIVDALASINEGLSYDRKNKDLNKLYDQIKGKYESGRSSFSEAAEFDDIGMIIDLNGTYGILDNKGESITKNKGYKKIFSLGSIGTEKGFTAETDNGIYYYDLDEYKRYTPDIKLVYLGTFNDGKALISDGKKWGYIDEDFSILNLEYEDATAFYDGYAAVKKNDKWAIIDSSLKEVTDYKYDNIITDDYKICSRGKVVFAKENGKYSLIKSINGETISGDYDNAKPFLGKNNGAAVSKNGKWGLIGNDGKEILKMNYEELGSESQELVPYKEKGKWGYLSKNGDVFISPEFSEVKAFNKNGFAAVKSEKSWELIHLYLFEK